MILELLQNDDELFVIISNDDGTVGNNLQLKRRI